jgi:predicted transcriptional regulator
VGWVVFFELFRCPELLFCFFVHVPHLFAVVDLFLGYRDRNEHLLRLAVLGIARIFLEAGRS